MTYPEYFFSLADGHCFSLRAGDEKAAEVVDFLAHTSQMPLAPANLSPTARRILAMTDSYSGVRKTTGDLICPLESTDKPRLRKRQLDEKGRLTLVAEPMDENQWFWSQLVRLSAFIGWQVQERGGALIHSASAQSPQGSAVLLAGRSGVGKSTASRRLLPPWHSLSDDVTLVVRDRVGTYWAHPWPTWSRFFGLEAGDGSDHWNVQHAVPLRAIFVLEQGAEDQAQTLGKGQAVCLLAELSQQASHRMQMGMPLDEIAAFNLERFNNLCALVHALPIYQLHVSLEGAFWEEIEQVLYS
jgi:SynChlorMet cassette protein ScmC